MSAHAIPGAVAYVAVGIPEPVLQCDGTWRVPLWTPDEGWVESTWDPDDDPAQVAGTWLRPRAECPEPGACTALHEEDCTPAELARIRGRQ